MKHQAMFAIVVCTLLLGACTSAGIQRSTSAIDYLYPQGKEAEAPRDVAISLPVRIGVAFAPPGLTPSEVRHRGSGPDLFHGDISLNESQRLEFLTKISDDLKSLDFVSHSEALPSLYFKAGGSFEQLEQLRAAFGLDQILLLSYEQTQFSDSNAYSVSYLTVMGAYVINGQDNDTVTFLDAVVVDIASRSLLFRATGSHQMKSVETAIDSPKVLRDDSIESFHSATDDLIVNLHAALSEFASQAATGTVRGLATPAIEITASGQYVQEGGSAQFEGGSFVGGYGLREFALFGLVVLGLAVRTARRRFATEPA